MCNFKKKQVFGILLFLFFCFSSFSQSLELSGEVNLKTMTSNGSKLPFWFYSNQRGRVSSNTDISSWISGTGIYNLNGRSLLEIGGALLYQNGLAHKVYIDELYASYRNTWLEVSVGRKQKEEIYRGLSAANQNMLWSLNARPLPGIQLKTQKPINFTSNGKWAFEAEWEEYLMGNDRYVKNTRLHHKSFHILYKTHTGWQIKAGIQHFAQWAGTSPDFGGQPHSFGDYLKIITGRGGGKSSTLSDKENALGNHIGSYELSVKKELLHSELTFLYNSIFEDGSGSRFANFPDGRYGLLWKSKKETFIKNLIYEFYYTRDQSHDVNKWGADNYFGHSLMYNSGWTYQGRIIGVPFFESDPENYRIKNNKFTAHHLGVSGQYSTNFHTYPFKLMLSYVYNEGTYIKEIHPGQDKMYVYFKTRLINHPFELNAELGVDYDSYNSPVYGAGLHLMKTF